MDEALLALAGGMSRCDGQVGRCWRPRSGATAVAGCGGDCEVARGDDASSGAGASERVVLR